jgi:hypothetical protein
MTMTILRPNQIKVTTTTTSRRSTTNRSMLRVKQASDLGLGHAHQDADNGLFSTGPIVMSRRMSRGAWIGVALVGLVDAPAHAEPMGLFGSGAGAYARMRSGFFLGADTGLAILESADTTSSAHDVSSTSNDRRWAYGVRAGFEWSSGLAFQARIDDLGVHAGAGNQAVMAASVGVRYSLPFVVMPFVDALVGPAFDGDGTSLGAGIGAGASILVTRHLGLDLACRDWMSDLGGSVRHIVTFSGGVQISFGR